MAVDEREDGILGQEGYKYEDFDGDGASVRFEDTEEETDTDSVMMVSF